MVCTVVQSTVGDRGADAFIIPQGRGEKRVASDHSRVGTTLRFTHTPRPATRTQHSDIYAAPDTNRAPTPPTNPNKWDMIGFVLQLFLKTSLSCSYGFEIQPVGSKHVLDAII